MWNIQTEVLEEHLSFSPNNIFSRMCWFTMEVTVWQLIRTSNIPMPRLCLRPAHSETLGRESRHMYLGFPKKSQCVAKFENHWNNVLIHIPNPLTKQSTASLSLYCSASWLLYTSPWFVSDWTFSLGLQWVHRTYMCKLKQVPLPSRHIASFC